MLKMKAKLISVALAMITTWLALIPVSAQAEYGDIILNNFAEGADVRPVVFPHWFHRVRFNCSVCHTDLNFKMKAGGNDITMAKVIEGEYCGACHNDQIAWGIENCDICHSGKPGLPTQVVGSALRSVNKANPHAK